MSVVDVAAAASSPDAAANVLLRTAGAGVASFLLGMTIGPVAVRTLRRLRTQDTAEKNDSQKLAELSKGKRDTPTMGGVMILAPLFLAVACFGNRANAYVVNALLGTIGFCLIGACDDVLKLTRRGKSGISGRGKMALQVGVSLALSFALVMTMKARESGDDLRHLLSVTIPFTSLSLDLSAFGGFPFVLFATLIMVATSNAVNLTDGLDGLAPGCVVVAAAAFAGIAYAVGRPDYAIHFSIYHVRGAQEMSIVAAALAGAALAFLWFNVYPARVFLGDTGSLALGGLLGYIAIVAKQELVLPIVGGVFMAEALSVIVQVVSFKSTGRRVFRCAPLHHHFQFGGMHEVTIVTRFWICAALCALLGLATLKFG